MGENLDLCGISETMEKHLIAIKNVDQSLHLIQKNKDVIIEAYQSSLEEKLLDFDILKDKFKS